MNWCKQISRGANVMSMWPANPFQRRLRQYSAEGNAHAFIRHTYACTWRPGQLCRSDDPTTTPLWALLNEFAEVGFDLPLVQRCTQDFGEAWSVLPVLVEPGECSSAAGTHADLCTRWLSLRLQVAMEMAAGRCLPNHLGIIKL